MYHESADDDFNEIEVKMSERRFVFKVTILKMSVSFSLTAPMTECRYSVFSEHQRLFSIVYTIYGRMQPPFS